MHYADNGNSKVLQKSGDNIVKQKRWIIKIVDDKKINFLNSLIRVAQSELQKKQSAERRKCDSTIVKGEMFTRKQEINVLKERVKTEPVVRQERVNVIREAIRNETYAIKSELVVRSILKSHLLDELLR